MAAVVILYGRVEKISTIKNYMSLQLSYRIPFKLNYQNFNIWDRGLKKTSRPLLGQDVSIILSNFQFNEFCFFFLSSIEQSSIA